MIAVDASAFVELLTDENGLARAVAEVLHEDGEWACPEHTITEVASALRGLWLGHRSTFPEFEARISALGRLEPVSYPVTQLLPRIVQLAPNASPYDAAYLALAEQLRATLVTMDRKLARVPGVLATVRVIDA